MEKEIRNLESKDCEIRVVPKGRTIEGYAIVFNKESRDLGGFREVIRPEAVEGVIGESDILALLNHNLDRGILARSTNGSGTLKLTIDSKGVRYMFDAPKTSLGDEVVEGIERGDIRTSSFAFTVGEGGEKWTKREGDYLREVVRFKGLYDVSAVYREAYEDTSVALRSLEGIKESIPEAIELRADPDPVVAATITVISEEGEAEWKMDDQSLYLEQRSIYLTN
jgi:HK97 family phage prohead protease